MHYIMLTSRQAMKYCPCARGVKRERCTCKNFEKIAAEDGSIFKEAMYNCKCEVGKTFNKCDNKNHIQALDYRAATFEALEKLDRAKKDAEWMLELAPRLPDVGTHLLYASRPGLTVYCKGISASRQDSTVTKEPRVCMEDL